MNNKLCGLGCVLTCVFVCVCLSLSLSLSLSLFHELEKASFFKILNLNATTKRSMLWAFASVSLVELVSEEGLF